MGMILGEKFDISRITADKPARARYHELKHLGASAVTL